MDSEPSFYYVEDDETSREVLEMLVRYQMGYGQFTLFEDSEDFVQQVTSGRLPVPDIVFLDIHMKPLNGFDVLRLLRQDSVFGNVRVIAVTASVMNEEVEQLRQEGFDGALGKPIDPDEFPGLLQRILNGEEVWHVSS